MASATAGAVEGRVQAQIDAMEARDVLELRLDYFARRLAALTAKKADNRDVLNELRFGGKEQDAAKAAAKAGTLAQKWPLKHADDRLPTWTMATDMLMVQHATQGEAERSVLRTATYVHARLSETQEAHDAAQAALQLFDDVQTGPAHGARHRRPM